jgi:hypothetical protein
MNMPFLFWVLTYIKHLTKFFTLGFHCKLRKCLHSALFLFIKSHLENLHFQIRHGSVFSDVSTINPGVPQGGILSPILFNWRPATAPCGYYLGSQ